MTTISHAHAKKRRQESPFEKSMIDEPEKRGGQERGEGEETETERENGKGGVKQASESGEKA